MKTSKNENWMYIIRTRLGLSQRKLASMIGLSAATISDIENGLNCAYSNKTFAQLRVFDLGYDTITNLRPVSEAVLDDEYFNKLRKRLGMEDRYGKV